MTSAPSSPASRTPRPTAHSSLVCVAQLAGAFGVKGEGRVMSFTALPEDCFTYGPWLTEDGETLLTPKSWRRHGDGFAVTFEESVTREQLMAMKGARAFVPRSALPDLTGDEFYHHDLIGLEVCSLDGEALGRVAAVLDFGAGEMLEVAGGPSGSWMLPFTRDNVPEIRLGSGYLVADPPEAAPDEDAPETFQAETEELPPAP